MATIYGQCSVISSGLSKPFAVIIVTFPSGTTNVTLTGNGKTWKAAGGHSTKNIYFVTDIGYTYTLSGSKDGESKSETISVDQAFQDIKIELSFTPAWYTTLKSMSVGQTITIDSMVWKLVNKTSSAAVLGLNTIYSMTVFGSNVAYKGSILASVASDFETNQLSEKTKQYLNSVTVPGQGVNYDVTAKCFVPSRAQFDGENGGFSYYDSNEKRKCQYQGSNAKYWTSASTMEAYVFNVRSDGIFDYYGGSPGGSGGFRPHMEVNLTL